MNRNALFLIVAALCAGCASAPPSAAPEETVTKLRFDTDADLAAWRNTGGDWRLDHGTLLGTQVGDTAARLTWPVWYGRISSVTIHGGIVSEDNRNFRVAVGGVSAILNWEERDVNVYRNGFDGHDVGPHALPEGDRHEIRLTEENGVVRVCVDGRSKWETPGHLRGALTIYPAVKSTIRVRDVEIRGVPVPWISVDGPDQRTP